MIEEVLDRLSGEAGVIGSLVLTPDGLMVAHRVGQPGERIDDDLDADRIAAIAGDAITRLRRALAPAAEGAAAGFDRFVLEAAFGKLVIVDVGRAALVVVTDRRIDLEMTRIAIEHAAFKLKA